MRTEKLLCLSILLVIFLSGICIFGQDKNDEESGYGREFIEALNTDSEKRRRELIQGFFAKSELEEKGVDRFVAFMTQLGSVFSPIEYHHSEFRTAKTGDTVRNAMHVFAKQKSTGKWKNFQFWIEPKPSLKIVRLLFVADVTEPVTLPKKGIGDSGTRAWINEYVARLAKEEQLYGSILIAKGDEILIERYFGFEEAAKTNPISPQTVFNVGSGSKMFTALCIAQLVEKGKLSYEDKITRFLDGFSDKKMADRITVRHLLTHSSGVSEYWTKDTREAVLSAKNNNDLLKLVYGAGFDFKAGTRHLYSNSNFVLLGAIIEKVSGKNFYSVVKNNILNRARMNATGYFEFGSKKTANPLTRSEDGSAWILTDHHRRGSAAGGAYSNVRDILGFSNALKGNALVSRRAFEQMTTRKEKAESIAAEEFGLGFLLRRSASGKESYGHGGTAAGVNFEFRYYPSQDITLAVFSNQNNEAFDDLKNNVIKLIEI